MTIDPRLIHNIHMEITIKAYAKLNLTLEVLRKRPDGYHDLSTIMQQISVFDSVYMLPRSDGDICVSCDVALPSDNTAFRAARLFMEHTQCGGAQIRIQKRIPMQAGMGGGSADAAAVLEGMQRLYGRLPSEELLRIAERIGADVPFCVNGGCALCEGKGELITPLRGLKFDVVVVKGSRGISTGMLFGELGGRSCESGATRAAAAAIAGGDLKLLCACISNGLEQSARRHCEEIGVYCDRLKRLGALCACMTGTGSAVFGVFESPQSARAALAEFSDCEFAAYAQTL